MQELTDKLAEAEGAKSALAAASVVPVTAAAGFATADDFAAGAAAVTGPTVVIESVWELQVSS